MSIQMLLSNFSVGFVVSLIWAAFGFAVAKVKHDEEFEPRKFMRTLVIGLMLGLLSALTGIDITTLQHMSVATVFLILTDKFVGMIPEINL